MAVALLVAAGSGERLGAGRPKAFVVLGGRRMIEWSLDALRAAGIEEIVVTAPPEAEIDGDGAVTVGGETIALGARVVAGGGPRPASGRAAPAGAPAGGV